MIGGVERALRIPRGRDRQLGDIGSLLCRFLSSRLLEGIYPCKSSISHLIFNHGTQVIPLYREPLLVVSVLETLKEQLLVIVVRRLLLLESKALKLELQEGGANKFRDQDSEVIH